MATTHNYTRDMLERMVNVEHSVNDLVWADLSGTKDWKGETRDETRDETCDETRELLLTAHHTHPPPHPLYPPTDLSPWPATILTLTPPTIIFADSSTLPVSPLRLLPFTSFPTDPSDLDSTGAPYQTLEPFGTFKNDVFNRNWRFTSATWNMRMQNFQLWQNDVVDTTIKVGVQAVTTHNACFTHNNSNSAH